MDHLHRRDVAPWKPNFAAISSRRNDGSIADLGRLQRILDGKFIDAEKTQELQALGIVFGKVFVNETPHYDWWVVDDEYGKDACIRYKETSLMSFPQSMISKRVEDGEEIDVLNLYEGLADLLERTRKENYPNA
jgi:hypothetical protein